MSKYNDWLEAIADEYTPPYVEPDPPSEIHREIRERISELLGYDPVEWFWDFEYDAIWRMLGVAPAATAQDILDYLAGMRGHGAWTYTDRWPRPSTSYRWFQGWLRRRVQARLAPNGICPTCARPL